MFLLLPLSTFSTQQDNLKCGPFKCHQVCKSWKALPVNIKQNHCRFHGITFLHCKESREDRQGSFRVGVWMRTLCECEWKLYILCYFNRLCLFSLKEIVWEKIGLSSFYFISMHLCTFTKINLLSHVINSCFTIVLVHCKVRNQSRETKHLFLWWMKHISLPSFSVLDITWTFASQSEQCPSVS